MSNSLDHVVETIAQFHGYAADLAGVAEQDGARRAMEAFQRVAGNRPCLTSKADVRLLMRRLAIDVLAMLDEAPTVGAA